MSAEHRNRFERLITMIDKFSGTNPFDVIARFRSSCANALQPKPVDVDPDSGVYMPQDLQYEINYDTGSIPKRYVSAGTVRNLHQQPGAEHGLQFYLAMKMMDGSPRLQENFLREVSTAILHMSVEEQQKCFPNMVNTFIDEYVADSQEKPMVDAGKAFQYYKVGPYNFSSQIAKQTVGTQTKETVPALLAYSGMIGYPAVLRQQISEYPEGTIVIILDSHIGKEQDTYGFVVCYSSTDGACAVIPVDEEGFMNLHIDNRKLILVDDTKSTGATLERVNRFCAETNYFTQVAESRCAFNPGNGGLKQKN